MVEGLPALVKALGLIFSTAKKKKKWGSYGERTRRYIYEAQAL